MDSKKEVLNHLLVVLFNQILSIEEKALKKGPFNNLTIGELHVIEAIGDYSENAMTAIATRLDVTVGTLTIAINNLVRKGFTTREKSEIDRRVVLIGLTDLGREAYNHHKAFHEEMIAFTMSSLDEAEGDVLIKALSKINDYFNKKY